MMDVQRMRRIVDVIESGALPAVAQEAARRWQGEALHYVRSSANHVFRFSLRDGETCYLRLTPAAERSRAAIQAELEFIEHVAHDGMAVARPLPSVAGELIEEVQDAPDSLRIGGPSDTQRYYAVVFEGLQGRQLELEELHEAHFRAWGRARRVG
jgi:Ser/Thr protein kinase RdoA (MazF antagonist)